MIAAMSSSSSMTPAPFARWELFTAFTAFIMAISLPLEQMAYHASYTHPMLFITRWIGYIVFSIDFIVRLRRKEYRGSANGNAWFLLDLFAALPVGPVLMRTWTDAPGWLMVSAHLLPVLRIIRTYTLSREWQHQNPATAGIRRIASTLVFIALCTHWIGCWQIAVYDASPETHIAMRYLQAIYWTVTTMTTIGYGDITPDKTNAGDLLFTMLIMVIGAGAFGFIIGNIASFLANLDFARNQHLDKMQRINAFMRYNDIPEKLREQVHGYYNYLWRTRKGFDESEILTELPASIRIEMEMHLRRDIVAKVPFFRGADNYLLRALVVELKPLIALPGEYIIRKGEIGDKMYFIASGTVDVLGTDKTTPIATLTEGSFFGEIALMEKIPRGADVRASTYCDLYTLSRAALEHVITQYPEFGEHVRKLAAVRKGSAPVN